MVILLTSLLFLSLMVCCVFICFFILKNNHNKQLIGEKQELLKQNSDLLSKIEEYKQGVIEYEKKIGIMSAEISKKEGEVDMLIKQKEFEKDIKIQMENTFKNLSTSTIKEQGKISNDELSKILEPFKEQMRVCKEAIDNVNGTTKAQITTKIDEMMNRTINIGQSADNLSNALLGKKKLQGNLGEMQLQNLFEAFGLVEGQDFFSQENVKDGAGKNFYPDFIIRMPQNKWLVVDSKMSLINYYNYFNETDKVKKDNYLKEYTKDIIKHMKELYLKEYNKLLQQDGKNSANFVCMFVPLEQAYLLALENNREEIFKLSNRYNIAIVTATSLSPVIQLISQLWSVEKTNKNIQEAGRLIEKWYIKVNNFMKDIETIGSSLRKAQENYDNAKKKLTDGDGNAMSLVKKAMEKIGKISETQDNSNNMVYKKQTLL